MSEQLFSDDPITTLKEDRLERGAFAKQVAQVCQNVAKESSSSVVALVGSWGSGKSSILSLTKTELKKSKWSVAEFNPWLMSDLESLMMGFFDEIIEAIPTDTDEHKNLRKKIGGYARTISPLGKLGSIVGVDTSEIIKKAGDLIEGDQSLTKKRDELVKELKKLKKPILVILDDIDRLHPDELLMVFKLVRLVGRLPNLHYLLSYDEDTLLDVLSQTDLSKGDMQRARSYIEKMVQVKLDLPHLNSNQQLKLINLSLDEVLSRNSITLNDEDKKRLSEAYRDCLSFYLGQPRAIKRYFAQIEALYPLVVGEVNFTDFALLTFLRTFEPGIYRLVTEYKIELTGQGFMTPDHDEKKEEKMERWLSLVKERGAKHPDAIFELLTELFLPLKSAKHNTMYSHKDEHLQKRVGHKDYFDRYFIFGVPEDDIPDAELLSTVELLLTDPKAASTKLNGYITKDASLALRKLKDLQEKGSLPAKETLVILGKRYATLPSSEGFFSTPTQWTVSDIVKGFTEKMSAKDRLAIFKEIASSSSGVLMLIHIFMTSKEDKEKPLAKSLQDLLKTRLGEVMEGLAKKKFSNIGEQDTDFLYPYKTLYSNQALTRWLWQRVDNQKWDPIVLLAKLVPESTAYGSDGPRKLISDIGNERLEDYFGLDRLLKYSESEIKKVVIKEDHSYRDEKPTLANKKSYVLRLLKNRYDNKLAKEAEKESGDEDSSQDTPKRLRTRP